MSYCAKTQKLKLYIVKKGEFLISIYRRDLQVFDANLYFWQKEIRLRQFLQCGPRRRFESGMMPQILIRYQNMKVLQ